MGYPSCTYLENIDQPETLTDCLDDCEDDEFCDMVTTVEEDDGYDCWKYSCAGHNEIQFWYDWEYVTYQCKDITYDESSSDDWDLKENDYFTVMGDCEVTETNCVNSPNYPANHKDDEECTVTVRETGFYTLSDPFDVEDGYDFLIVDGETVTSPWDEPKSLDEGDVITWESDYMMTRTGWEICWYSATTDAPTTRRPTPADATLAPTTITPRPTDTTPSPTQDRVTPQPTQADKTEPPTTSEPATMDPTTAMPTPTTPAPTEKVPVDVPTMRPSKNPVVTPTERPTYNPTQPGDVRKKLSFDASYDDVIGDRKADFISEFTATQLTGRTFASNAEPGSIVVTVEGPEDEVNTAVSSLEDNPVVDLPSFDPITFTAEVTDAPTAEPTADAGAANVGDDDDESNASVLTLVLLGVIVVLGTSILAMCCMFGYCVFNQDSKKDQDRANIVQMGEMMQTDPLPANTPTTYKTEEPVVPETIAYAGATNWVTPQGPADGGATPDGLVDLYGMDYSEEGTAKSRMPGTNSAGAAIPVLEDEEDGREKRTPGVSRPDVIYADEPEVEGGEGLPADETGFKRQPGPSVGAAVPRLSEGVETAHIRPGGQMGGAVYNSDSE